MLEVTGDLWAEAEQRDAWAVVTTNGALTRDGSLVMGAGVAGQAAKRYPTLAAELGRLVAVEGNVPVAVPSCRILTWPTKPDSHTLADGSTHPGWMCCARVKDPTCRRGVARLTANSGKLLIALVDHLAIERVVLPRPGCGLAGLNWDGEVGPWAARTLDDRFVVVSQ